MKKRSILLTLGNVTKPFVLTVTDKVQPDAEINSLLTDSSGAMVSGAVETVFAVGTTLAQLKRTPESLTAG